MKADETQKLSLEYRALCHAMQTGVAAKMNYDGADCQPKHLRVGVNSAMVSHAAVVELLVSKGVITKEEYARSLCDQMRAEVERYRAALKAHGLDVDLA